MFENVYSHLYIYIDDTIIEIIYSKSVFIAISLSRYCLNRAAADYSGWAGVKFIPY